MKLPPQAKQVFKGIIYDVYHWEQEMFDGSRQTFEMLKRPDTLQVIAIQGDKILIGHESQPTKKDFYTLLGGRAEAGEEPLQSAKRELLEESGTQSDDWELYKAYEPVHKIDWIVHTYIARDCQKTTEPKLDAGEKIAVEAVDFDQFIDIIDSDKFWGNEFRFDIVRMKLEPSKLEEFKKKLYLTN